MYINKSFILLSYYFARHKQVVKLLLDCSANVNIQADDGCTAFDMASIIGKDNKIICNGNEPW
jgi:hypothetical protein